MKAARLFWQQLIRLYPRAWRERYGEEFDALLAGRPLTWRTAIDVGRAAMMERFRQQSDALSAWQRALRLIGVMAGAFLGLVVVSVFVDAARFQHRMATPADFANVVEHLLHPSTGRANPLIGLFNLWFGPYLVSLLLALVVRASTFHQRSPRFSRIVVVLGWTPLLFVVWLVRAAFLFRLPEFHADSLIVCAYFALIGLSVSWALLATPRQRGGVVHEG